MKKLTFIVCLLMLLAMLAGCKADESEKAITTQEDTDSSSADAVCFVAQVLDNTGDALLVKVTDGKTSRITEGSEAWISSYKEENIDFGGFMEGDIVQVYFNGLIMESYPLKIDSVTEIGYFGVVTTEKTALH